VAEDAESSDIESSSASSSHSSSEQAAPSTPSESAVVTAGEEKDEKTSNVDSSKQGERGSVIACRYVEPWNVFFFLADDVSTSSLVDGGIFVITFFVPLYSSNAVALNIFSNTPPLSDCLLFQAPPDNT